MFLKNCIILLFVSVYTVLWCAPGFAVGVHNAEIMALQERVDQLEAALSEVKALLKEKTIGAQTMEPVVSASYDMKLYGYVKLDMAYDTQRTGSGGGNFARYVLQSTPANDGDDEFNMTARQTRLGLLVDGGEYGDAKVGGRLEIDFYGGGSEDTALPRLRLAYVDLKFPKWELAFGQHYDVFSPLVAPTINFGILEYSGDLGYRIPQVRLTNYWDICGRFTTKIAAARNLNNASEDGDSNDDGEDAPYPELQALLDWTGRLWGRTVTFQLSGVLGQEEVDWSGDGDEGSTYDVSGFSFGLIYAVEDRVPRHLPWVNEPDGDIIERWKSSNQDIVHIISSITLFGYVSIAVGS